MTHSEIKLSVILDSQERIHMGVAEMEDFMNIRQARNEFINKQAHELVNMVAIMITAVSLCVAMYAIMWR